MTSLRPDRRHARTRRAALTASLVLTFLLPAGSAVASSHEADDERAARADGLAAVSADEWIARSSLALVPEQSMKARARLVTDDGFGGESTTVMDMMRGRFDDAWRTLIEVEAPEAGKGVVYEIVAHPERPLERWVWLPYEERLRKLTGLTRTDPFMGSEFTYEDLGLTVPAERGDGEVRLIGVGAGHIVEIESEPYHIYSRVVTRIDPQTALPTVVRFYDRADQLFRTQAFQNVREVDGHPFPMEIVIRNLLTGAESTLSFDRVEFGAEIPERVFSESMVRRRLRAAKELVPDSVGSGGEAPAD